MERLSRPISDFAHSRETATVGPQATVAEAIAAMRERDLHCVYVVDGDSLVGVFTERDFVRRVLGPGKAQALPVSELMTPGPESLRGEDNITYAINMMAVGGYRNVPVVDDAGALVGSIGVRDVVAHLADVLSSAPGDDEPDDDYVDLGGGG